MDGDRGVRWRELNREGGSIESLWMHNCRLIRGIFKSKTVISNSSVLKMKMCFFLTTRQKDKYRHLIYDRQNFPLSTNFSTRCQHGYLASWADAARPLFIVNSYKMTFHVIDFNHYMCGVHAFGKMAMPSFSMSLQIPPVTHHLSLNNYANTQCISHFFTTFNARSTNGKRRSFYLRWGKGGYIIFKKNVLWLHYLQ